ncbi:unnamed protein product [Dibothriocephalus latus]|uniref:Uncharacterized protein n=1 Tax=Dibothriocephalus latus TaxID=60516 RepID=A0A3P6QAV9_DIBLA|nr:unnamed protein product [Dibothriocephalus latus]
MKAGDGENNEIVVGGGGGGGTTGGTFQCPPGMEGFWQALSADLAYAQACLVCALLVSRVPWKFASFLH